ncbi:MAG TPA: DUF5602 domain-containing protein [Gemmatimonadaceae bacterium]|nr:DUF5602 domain-containing protein [Gemmatimonadaceae bacterium]
MRIYHSQRARRMISRRTVAGLSAFGLLGATAVLAASCSDDTTGVDSQPVTEFGTPVTIGDGTARSYIVMQDGKPTELGIALSEAAAEGLPTQATMMGYEYLLPLPATNPTQFQIVAVNWNPTGHPPPMVYTVPHFDFHFYMMSLADRNAIVASDPAFATKAANVPGEPFRQPGYVADPPEAAVPMMGLHWTDPAAPEFHGEPFTRTYITGSWNGQLTFFEPMVTREYLLSHPNDSIPVGSAAQRAIPGFYPTAYRVRWDAANEEWQIALSNLVQ